MLNHRNTEGKSIPIFINDDLTKKDQEINFNMRNFAKEMRMKNKEVKLAFRKVCVSGEWYHWDEDTKMFVSQKN